MHPSFKCSSLAEMKRGVVNSFSHISLAFVHTRFHTSSIYCINRIFGGRITDGWCIHSKDRHRSEEWVHMAQRPNAVSVTQSVPCEPRGEPGHTQRALGMHCGHIMNVVCRSMNLWELARAGCFFHLCHGASAPYILLRYLTLVSDC